MRVGKNEKLYAKDKTVENIVLLFLSYYRQVILTTIAIVPVKSVSYRGGLMSCI